MTESDFDNIENNSQEEDFTNVKNSVRHRQKERKLRKKRKKANRLKAFLKFIFFVLLCFLIYEFFVLPQWYLDRDAFNDINNSSIEIINNKIVPNDVIRMILKDTKVRHLPIFMMNVNPIKRELLTSPVFKSVYVRRYGFPARIQIIVIERVPTAIIKADLNSKPLAFFTQDNLLINHSDYMNLSDSKNVLKILTLKTDLEDEITVKKMREIDRIVKEVETYSNEKVEYFDMRKPNDVYVKIRTTNIRLGALDSTVYERIKRIYTILPQITDINSRIEYIDLSWDKVNYLKMKKGANAR